MKIAINQIIPDPNQPRKTFKKETLQGLRDSYDDLGLIQPLTVRPHDNKYMVIVGERRFRAAKLDGLAKVECIKREDVNDKIAREMQFAENSQQEDIPPLELGKAFSKHRRQWGITKVELAKIVGLTPEHIGRLEELATNAALEIQSYVKFGKLDASTAFEIGTIKDKGKQAEVAEATVKTYLPSAKEAGLPRSIVRPIVSKVKEEPNRSVKDIVEEVVYGQPMKQEPVKLEPSPIKLTGDSLILMMDYQRLLNNLARMQPHKDGIPEHAKKALVLKGIEVINAIQDFSSDQQTLKLESGGK